MLHAVRRPPHRLTGGAIVNDPLFARFGGAKLADRLHRSLPAPNRPLCDAFKPVPMWRAMLESDDGDYIEWADASRYLNAARHESALGSSRVTDAIAILRGDRRRGPAPDAWGASERWARTEWWKMKPRDARRERTGLKDDSVSNSVRGAPWGP